MAVYKKQSMVGGQWAKAADIKNGIHAKITSETNPQSSLFLNKDGSAKTQDVCKVQFEGMGEALNVSLNGATKNGLIDAFGEDSKLWMNKYLTVETEKMRVGGKAVTAMYLIPTGYKRVDDDNGYAKIVPEGEEGSEPIPPLQEEAEIKADEIPF